MENKTGPVARIGARPTRLSAASLLQAAGLPTDDLTDAKLEHFFCAGEPSAPVGLVGVELYGPDALLRSLVVAPGSRASGIGARLVAHAEAHAAAHGAGSVYLLTTTAERFFAARGYLRSERSTAPDSIRATGEFASLCPVTAVFMVKRLDVQSHPKSSSRRPQ